MIDVNPNAAPVEAPKEIKPETGLNTGFEGGVAGGVEGGVPGGVVGGVVGGLPEAPPPPPPPQAPVRVGGNIKPPNKIRDVPPVYPPIAQSARVQGVVIIEATIGPTAGCKDAQGAPLDPAARPGRARRGAAVGVHADAAERRARAGHHDRHGQLHAAVGGRWRKRRIGTV